MEQPTTTLTRLSMADLVLSKSNQTAAIHTESQRQNGGVHEEVNSVENRDVVLLKSRVKQF